MGTARRIFRTENSFENLKVDTIIKNNRPQTGSISIYTAR